MLEVFKKRKIEKLSKINPVLNKYLNVYNDLTIYDIGANKGKFTNDIKSEYNIKQGILVEPIPENSDYIKNVFNGSSYHVFNNAVSDVDNEKIIFNINKFDETSSLLKIRNEMTELDGVDVELDRQIEVTSTTLDSITEKLNINEIHLLKIDVQGAEDKVLLSAAKTLSKTKLVWVETSFKRLYENSALFEDVCELMRSNGFLLMEISPGYRDPNTGELLQADVLFKNRIC